MVFSSPTRQSSKQRTGGFFEGVRKVDVAGQSQAAGRFSSLLSLLQILRYILEFTGPGFILPLPDGWEVFTMGVEYKHFFVVKDLSWIGSVSDASNVHEMLARWNLADRPPDVYSLDDLASFIELLPADTPPSIRRYPI